MTKIEIKNYSWRDGSRIQADPQVIGEEIERITNGSGQITVIEYLIHARTPSSPLWNTITHDPLQALDKWNAQEARHVISCLEIKELENKNTERMFLNISNKNGTYDGTYTKVTKIKTDPELREIALKNALNELKAFRRKYKEIKELTCIFNEIDKMT